MKYFVIFFVTVLLAGTGCTATRDVSGITTTPETVSTQTTSEGEDDIRVNADITADVATTVSCGDQDCFETQFKDCKPATLTSDAGLVSFSYQIIGPVTGGCRMTVLYPTNPNPEWENKPMTCTFNNSLEFTAAVQAQLTAISQGNGTCTGPLADIIKS